MGIRNWLRPKTRVVDNHKLASSYSFFFGSKSAGKPVTERSMMQVTVAYACVRILSEAIAGLPLHVYRYATTDPARKPWIARCVCCCMISRTQR